ncbi:MAG: chromosome segregation protein SMC [Deltaproteobacteria bacterium HGW-Deltaproteobacteria-19]|nr:MAG: chromosome segregation protein SMC [Deltaproteobacteria bacterium HGW-Deltaproteobacteria-19]
MRILGVHFKNLNSLAGEWQGDFTHPNYSSDGIFAITGPTGSGKTTIMDAICLGLYGRTPRLERVTKNSNEIMSRQTGECFAEVTFETRKGRYRSHWSQRRARRRADGELQPAKHEVADAESGAVLESKINETNAFIENATGMDFGRFTRSMLLAQGGFDVFLQAPPSERAPILEQITGTGIYSLISMEVHKRRVEEDKKLETLQAGLKGIRVLSEDDEKGLRIVLEENQAREGILDGRLKEMNGALAWLDGIRSLEKERTELEGQRNDLDRRRQEFEPESGRLEKARKALVLEAEYTAVAGLRTLQVQDTKELDSTAAVIPGKQKAVDRALEARQTAETLLNEIRRRQAAEAEVIRSVRDLDARLGEQKKQLEEKTKAIVESETQAGSYRSRIAAMKEEWKDADATLKIVEEYRTTHAADASLPADLNAIEKGFASLRGCTRKYQKVMEDLAGAMTKRESVLGAFDKAETGHEKIRLATEKKQEELKTLTDGIVAALEDRDISLWRDEMGRLKDREHNLMQVKEIIERMEGAREAADTLGKRLDALRGDHARLSEEIKAAREKKDFQENDITALETQVALLNRIRDLEEERKRLEDGKPCPLCGATDHPYARGNVPALNEAEAALKKAKQACRKTSKSLSDLETALARTKAEMGHVEKELAEKQEALGADEKRCAEVLLKLGMEVPPEERSEKVRDMIAGTQANLARIFKIVSSAEELGKKEKAARADLEKSREKFEHAAKALQEARHQVETTTLDHERLKEEAGVLAEEVKALRISILKDIERYGIAEISADELDSILKKLTVRRDDWRAKEEEKQELERKVGERKADIEKDGALLTHLEKDLEGKRMNCDALKAEHEALGVSRRDLFGDKDANNEERLLSDAVDQAAKTFEKARDEHGKAEQEVGSLKEKIVSLQEKKGKRASELAEVERSLAERIKTAGFAGEAEYLSSRLAEEEREILAGRENSLNREKTELEARWKDKTERLASEREKNLTDQSGEELKEGIGTCNAELKQTRLDRGGVLKTLEENEKFKEEQQDRLKIIEAQGKECARWAGLHDLIGSADGKKFRNFAQGLTFEMMIAHANRQLGKMTDRYLLVRDTSTPLELNVVDNYQAGETRSTKNLSGGESFIVSLALALGLSHMASRNVPVDSLFLDEGFGTLDEDALETALETLAGLKQDGKLIGVISHVTALKERIGTQIQIIPETGGRSILSGPGCRRI